MPALSDAWKMSQEANYFLLSHIDEDFLDDKYSARTRTVRKQFTHIHNVRHRWLSHSAPKLVDFEKFDKRTEPTKDELLTALEASGAAIAAFLDQIEEKDKVPSWKGNPASFFGYIVAHEAHHRGLAMVSLRISGHKMPQEVIFGQWDWGKKR
ncbi:MAG: DinB family protein [Bacteroidota bacterium]